MGDIHGHRLLILDFGSQYTQLIARRVREAGVYCEIHPFDMEAEAVRRFGARGIIFSGGPDSATVAKEVQASAAVFNLGVPVLGICYGMQTMAVQLGGEVESAPVREFGYAQVQVHGHSRLLTAIEDHADQAGETLLDVWMSHGDRVVRLPPGFKIIASSAGSPIAGMADERRCLYGLQFHPEVTHTRQGARILQRFTREICGCAQDWTTHNIIEAAVAEIREQVGGEPVIAALSGGVDSSVVATLVHKAVGDQLTCVFVDNGLLRLQEAEQVMNTFAQHLGMKVIHVDAEERFLEALADVTDPEQKRKIIGRVFIEVFEQEARRMGTVQWLAQGTIYPDVIESAAAKTGKAEIIKSHHNVGGLPERMSLKLIEPLRELFKDEVRRLGLELGLPYEQVYRHPFPGPGLAVRILGAVTKARADTLRQADAIFIQELKSAGLYGRVSQAFAVFLPVKSVAVKGDARHYDHVIALRAVETVDFMTANWARLPYEFLDTLSRRIINEVPGVSRVTYDISSKPPATIEWE
ncbi:MAG: glutamine-hydrolyzing GMP synthase [Gammaproteobacteria bacterium]